MKSLSLVHRILRKKFILVTTAKTGVKMQIHSIEILPYHYDLWP